MTKNLDINCYVVFEKLNSIISGTLKNNTCTFKTLPKGEKVSIIVFGSSGNSYYVSYKKNITLGSINAITLQPQEITLEGLKKYVKDNI